MNGEALDDFAKQHSYDSPLTDLNFGVPELVLGREEVGPFVPNEDYTAGPSDDRAVAAKYVELQKAGHPKLQPPPQHQGTGWENLFRATCTSVAESFRGGSKRGKELASVYKLYPLYNTRACPAMTPECLQFLDPAFTGGRDCLVAYRKCCVEHRRLKLMVEWMVGMLTSGVDGAIIQHHVRAGGLLGLVRDGGVLMGSDTDVDVSIDPELHLKLSAMVLNSHPPKWLTLRRPKRHHVGAKPRWIIPWPAWPELRSNVDGDTHLELYYYKSVHNEPFTELRHGATEDDVFLRCKWYGQGATVQVAADWPRLAMDDFKHYVKKLKLMKQHKTPNIHGMYGLHWCGPVGTCCGEDGQPLAPRGYDAAGPIDV